MAAAVRSHALDGVIATNTSTGLPGYERELARAQGGGISGAPLTRSGAVGVARSCATNWEPQFPSSASADS